MKFASFNLYQYLKPPYFWYERKHFNTYTQEQWQQKQAWIIQQLRKINADIVGLQEVFSTKELQKLVKKLGYAHFATVAETKIHETDSEVLIKPVVAIASRYPIKQCGTIDLSNEVTTSIPLKETFEFSRPPLCASIDTDELGEIDVYVTHLKSKRPQYIDTPFAENTPWKDRAFATLRKVSRGNIAALLQRGAESTFLYHHISETLYQQPQKPCVVLGDLNDDEESIALQAMLAQSRINEIGEVDHRDWPRETKKTLHDLRLYDSFDLLQQPAGSERPATHIHRGKGGVLDYALVNNALNPRNPERTGELCHYQVFNNHLDDDDIANRLQSDHGQVLITIRPKEESAKENTGRIYWAEMSTPLPDKDYLNTKLNRINRDEFISLAGGVFYSSKKYKHWRGSDKWQNFWSFFFDNDYGYVKSVYGAIPVDELYQKRKHSIEHIIPKSFLNEYLLGKGSPRHMRYGASVNPFNFIPAHRQLNASRSSFPFGFENNSITRPAELDFQPEAYVTKNQDDESEWVIPSRSRGDIARSMLYMCMVYGIEELYNRHIESMVHWAKVDAPSDWEIAYNHWVKNRLGISNPFINSKEHSLALLSNQSLLGCLEHKGS